MRKNARIILRVLSSFIFIIAQVVLFIFCFKTLMFDYYDPRDLILTYVHIMAISGCFVVIRWMIKPEFNHDFGFSDFGQYLYCDDCGAKYHPDDKKCHSCGVDIGDG